MDDILLFPIRGLKFVLRELGHAAEQEFANEAQAIRSELTELYMMLETGRISEADFDAREGDLLDRLDAVESRGAGPGDGTDAESP